MPDFAATFAMTAAKILFATHIILAFESGNGPLLTPPHPLGYGIFHNFFLTLPEHNSQF